MFQTKPKTHTINVKFELLVADAEFLDCLCNDGGPLESPIDLEESVKRYILRTLKKVRSDAPPPKGTSGLAGSSMSARPGSSCG